MTTNDTWTHVAASIGTPAIGDKVFKDECPFTFQSADMPGGVYICLKNLMAIGPKMLKMYWDKTGCRAFLHYTIQKEFKAKDTTVSEIHPTKLGIGTPGGFDLPQDRYRVSESWELVLLPEETHIAIPCPTEANDRALTDSSHLSACGLPVSLAQTVAFVQRAESALLAEERAKHVTAWEDENVRPISKHANDLVQLNNGVRISPTGWKCFACDLRDNLWLNLSDGTICCGRRFWDGTGGNNHAVEHYENTKYPLAVKLGTITPEGAEVFSYAEDDMVTDPLLEKHLAHFGIDIMRMKKTDKTVAELEISANERLGEWHLLQESDHKLEPRYGPGMTGLHNLGNSCYMNSVVQVLFAIPQMRHLYADRLPEWTALSLARMSNSRLLPLDHIGLQFAKLGEGLCSGAYAWPFPTETMDQSSEKTPVPSLPGIRPQLFRRLMGLHNATFRTRQQQDAFEFLIYLLDLLGTKAVEQVGEVIEGVSHHQAIGQSGSTCLQFTVEDRSACGLTGKVRYKNRDESVLCLPVPMEAMVNRVEYEAYETRRLEAESTGLKLAPEDVVRPQIPFRACLQAWAETERVEDFLTPASDPPGQRTFALRASHLLNFPDYLMVRMAKYTVGADWLPQKLDVEIQLDDADRSRLDLSQLRSSGGLQPGEVAMPEEDVVMADQLSDTTVAEAPFEPDAVLLVELTSMGFSEVACQKACMNTRNSGLEVATNWLMEHLDDADLNDPIAAATASSSALAHDSFVPNEDAVEMLTAMGFTRAQATKALKHTSNNLEAAADWALTNPDALNAPDQPANPPLITGDSATQPQTTNQSSSAQPPVVKSDGQPIYELCAFISHMGKATTHGHYVAHIRRSALSKGIPGVEPASAPPPSVASDQEGDEWIIFNDEKVARSQSPPHPFAYMYLFRRLDGPLSGVENSIIMAENAVDIYLPNAVILRIIKDALPDRTVVSREARSSISKAASSFILYVTSMASTHCEANKRKTLLANDILAALKDMHYGHYADELNTFLAEYREMNLRKKADRQSTSVPEQSDAPSTSATALDGEASDIEPLESTELTEVTLEPTGVTAVASESSELTAMASESSELTELASEPVDDVTEDDA